MTIWISLLLLLAVLSPMLWLLPSRRQKGQIEVRLRARQIGLTMHLAEPTWPHWLTSQPPRRCPQYLLPRRAGRDDSWTCWQTEPGVWVDRWQEACRDPARLAILEALPGDVYGVEAGGQMVCLYWGERGGEAELQQVASALKRLA